MTSYCFVRIYGVGTSGDRPDGRRSPPTAHENEAAHGDAQLQQEVVKRIRRNTAHKRAREGQPTEQTETAERERAEIDAAGTEIDKKLGSRTVGRISKLRAFPWETGVFVAVVHFSISVFSNCSVGRPRLTTS
jgi:hypothetical protein